MDELVEQKQKLERAAVIYNQCFKPDSYEWDDTPILFDGRPENATSTLDVIKCLENNTATIEAFILGKKDGEKACKRVSSSKGFLEAFKKSEELKTFREAYDSWGSDMQGGGGSLVGQDFTPSVMSPFIANSIYRITKKHKAHVFTLFTMIQWQRIL
jgi:hypothetical protein